MFADSHALSPVVAIQVPDNVLRRDPERALFPMAKGEDIAVTAWGLVGAECLQASVKIRIQRKGMKRRVKMQ